MMENLAAPANLSELIVVFLRIINLLVQLVFALSVLIFFRGLAKFILNAGDSKSHEEGKELIIWGLISLFVMVSVWGILRFVYNDLGLSSYSFGLPLIRP